jgi:hypothetical protein
MQINKMIKNGFECAVLFSAFGTMVFWAEVVTSFTG